MMPVVAQRVDVQCGKTERHSEECARLRLDGAEQAWRERRWKRWMVLRSVVTQRQCGCPKRTAYLLRLCSFAGEVDAELDVETEELVWTCPRCFADHFGGV